MKLTVRELRHAIREAGKIGASPEYMKKERIREQLQKIIADNVASGDIADQAALDQFIKDIGTSMTALKMIPFDVWSKMAGKPAKK